MFYFQVILQALGPTHLIWKLDDIDDPLRRKPVKSFAYAPPLVLLEFSPLLKIVFDAGSCPSTQKNYFPLVSCKKDRDILCTNFFFFFFDYWVCEELNLSLWLIHSKSVSYPQSFKNIKLCCIIRILRLHFEKFPFNFHASLLSINSRYNSISSVHKHIESIKIISFHEAHERTSSWSLPIIQEKCDQPRDASTGSSRNNTWFVLSTRSACIFAL